MDTIRT